MADEGSSSLPKYDYAHFSRPNSIRLIYLHPGAPETAIKVNLHEHTLAACPDFGALSYTWATEDGDTSLNGRLECDGALIRTTANCEAALRRLRDPQSYTVVWVDAVCIDQSDDDEKSQQIALMRQIYSRASLVWLWLGETSPEADEETSIPLSDLGMSFIHDFAIEIQERNKTGLDLNEGPLYQEFIKDRRAYLAQGRHVLTPRIQGFWDILHRRWWSRLWAVQELSLAEEAILVCGSKMEPFANLHMVINALVRRGPAEILDFNSSFLAATFHHFYMRATWRGRNDDKEPEAPGAKAIEILNATRNTRATDPRDKVYGILGFFGDPESDPDNILPTPDYKRTSAEVYSDVSRAIVKATRSLDVLTSCYGFVRSTIPDLPSWVVAWNDSPLKFFDEKSYNASKGSEVIYEDCDDSRFLRIKGRVVDSVARVAEITDSLEYTNESCVRIWREWADLAFSYQSHPTGASLMDVFQSTLCWDSNLTSGRLGPGEFQQAFDTWFKVLKSNESLDTAARKMFEDPTAYPYCRRASFMTWGRTLCTTKKSFLAQVPVTSQGGDLVVVFSGGKVPFVVRPEGEKYKLVGACYVHGIMDGEAVPNEDAALDSLEWFTLF